MNLSNKFQKSSLRNVKNDDQSIVVDLYINLNIGRNIVAPLGFHFSTAYLSAVTISNRVRPSSSLLWLISSFRVA